MPRTLPDARLAARVRDVCADGTGDVADVVIASLDARAVSRCLALLPEPQRAAGGPVTVTVRGQRIQMRTWRLGNAEAVVAVSGQPFPMPAGAQAAPGPGMVRPARLGKLTLYCLNGPTSELLAAPVPAADLAALTARLPLA